MHISFLVRPLLFNISLCLVRMEKKSYYRILVFSHVAHVETSIVAHLENASSQTEESKIAANFQTVYAKQFLLHKLYPNVNEQSGSVKTKINVWSSRVQHDSGFGFWVSYVTFL